MALALSMGAAVSLGITRFAYGLLLPPMRADLGWSYALAGGMNTANAFGYLMGALAMPSLMRRLGRNFNRPMKPCETRSLPGRRVFQQSGISQPMP